MKKASYILLFPISQLYGLLTSFRNVLFNENIFKSKYFEGVKTISVGNLCAGGTGKTPHIEYLIALLKDKYTVATLSRGYKRKTNKFLLADQQSTVFEIGDEPLQFKSKNPDLMVAVDGSRVRGVNQLMALQEPPEVILLDDAFQHRWIKPGLSILLTDFKNLYVHDTFLPSGYLRESKKGAQRADIIIVTRTPEYASGIEMRGIIKDLELRAHQSIYFSYLKYSDLYSFFDQSKKIVAPKDLFKYHVLVLTGIANDEAMLTYVKEYADLVSHIRFKDHHEFTNEDADDIRKQFEEISSEHKIIITTEKDAMRLKKLNLKPAWEGIPLYVLPIEVDFKAKTEEFNAEIFKYLHSNKISHKKYM